MTVLDEQLLLTPERAAERLDMSRTVIYELMSRGELRSVRIGRSRRIATTDLSAYVERLRNEAGAA